MSRGPKDVLVFALALVSALAFACGRGPKPPELAPSPVSVRATLGQSLVEAGAATKLLARIDLEAAARSGAKRPDVNLALVIDTSGSMDGRAIEEARKASLALIASLSPKDRIAIVTFDSDAELVLPSTLLEDADLPAVRRRIEAIRARGTTNLQEGLGKALAEVRAHQDPTGVNRVILLGDGVPNVAAGLREQATSAGGTGISVTTLGLGDDYDETLMGDLAQRSGGRFHYVADASKVAAFFAEEVVRLNQVVARRARLRLVPGHGVQITKVIGQQVEGVDGRALVVPLGDVSFGDRREIVVELAANGAKDGANVEVLDAVLEYADVAGVTAHAERAFAGAKAVRDASRIAGSRDETVEDAAKRARDAEATLEQIKKQRAEDGIVEDDARPAPAAPAPATPTPALGAMKPRAAPRDAFTPAEQRRRHDEAMRVLQGM